MIKILAIDMDGTLLDPQSKISTENKRAIQKCMDRGIKVSIVTGQNLQYARNIIESLGLSSPHVLANGALIVNEKLEKIHCSLIDPISYRKIVSFCRGKSLQLRVCTADGALVFDNSPLGISTDKENVIKDDLLAEHIANNVLLCTVKTPDGIVKINTEDISKDLKIRNAGLYYINIFNRKAGKTSGLKKILSYLDLSSHELMVVGDGENDIGMIKMAKIGVAMGNALPEIKKYADHVTLDNENNGLSVAIERFLLY
jgi:Cof subfamily protein (haloacid dehalogenase superfamily)